MIETVPKYIAVIADVINLVRKDKGYKMLIGDDNGQLLVYGDGLLPKWVEVGKAVKICAELRGGVAGGRSPHLYAVEVAHPRG